MNIILLKFISIDEDLVFSSVYIVINTDLSYYADYFFPFWKSFLK